MSTPNFEGRELTQQECYQAGYEQGKLDAVPEGYRILKDSTYKERAWVEDYKHENGNYFNTCAYCGRQFTGHKRRVVCKVCAAAPKQEK